MRGWILIAVISSGCTIDVNVPELDLGLPESDAGGLDLEQLAAEYADYCAPADAGPPAVPVDKVGTAWMCCQDPESAYYSDECLEACPDGAPVVHPFDATDIRCTEAEACQ